VNDVIGGPLVFEIWRPFGGPYRHFVYDYDCMIISLLIPYHAWVQVWP